jgi:hypothetical protein
VVCRFWISSGQGTNQLLYYGTDPFTPRSQLPLGPQEDNFFYKLTVRISNPIGEYVEETLTVQVMIPFFLFVTLFCFSL